MNRGPLGALLQCLLLPVNAIASDDAATDEGIKDPFTRPAKRKPAEDCSAICSDIRSKKANCDRAQATCDATKRAKKACKKGCQEGADKMYSEAAGGCDGSCREQVSRWLSACFTECASEHDEAGACGAKDAACREHKDAKSATKCECSDSTPPGVLVD